MIGKNSTIIMAPIFINIYTLTTFVISQRDMQIRIDK